MALVKADFLRGLHILANGGRATEARDMRAAAEAFYAEHERWRSGPGVIGFGVAARTVDRESTGELALKVYVLRKLARRAVDVAIPETLRVPGIAEPLPVDIEGIGELRLQRNDGRIRPSKCGMQICHPGGELGTLGCIVQRISDPGVWHILSAAHVLSPPGKAKKYDLIQQPALDRGKGRSHNAIASLNQVNVFDERYLNRFDAAIARVIHNENVDPEILGLGRLGPLATAIQVGMDVQMVGAASGHQQGRITDSHFCLRVAYPGSVAVIVGFQDQVLCSRYSASGDSGALIMDHDKRPLGIHLAGTEYYSVFSPLAPILNAWDLEIVRDSRAHPELTEAVSGSHTKPPVDDRDSAIDILARTLWGEAEGEPVAGKRAVAAVIVNRTKKPARFGASIERVCKRRNQFSCWDPGARRRQLLAVNDCDTAFRKCLELATQAVDGALADPVNGADHYHAQSVAPDWASGRRPCQIIGQHLFYNDIP